MEIPAGFLPLVVRKVQQEEACGVLLAPYWPAQAWFARMGALMTRMHVLRKTREGPPLLEGSRINARCTVVVSEVGIDTTGRLTSSPQF